MIRRLAAVGAAAAALALLAAPTAQAGQQIQAENPVLCVWARDLGVCIDNPIRRLP